MPFSFPSKIFALAGDAVSPLPLGAQVEALLKAGVRFIQIRSRLTDAELLPALQTAAALCRAKGAILILYENANFALQAQAHGVHIDGDPASVAKARSELGADFIIGFTVRSAAVVCESKRNQNGEAHGQTWMAAQSSGADYLLLEPIFPSANSPDQPPAHSKGALSAPQKAARESGRNLPCDLRLAAHGVSGLNRLAARGGLPLAAYGAISRDTLPIVLAAGAGAALVGRAIWKEKNPEAAARALLKLAGEGLALPVAQ